MTAAQAAGRQTVQQQVADGLTGNLAEQLGRLSWDAGRLARYQRGRLRALLSHAARHSAFHSARLAGFDPGRFELADLPRLPVMTKEQLMASFDGVVTDPRLRRGAVEAHLTAAQHEPRLLFGEYVCLASGGSSGRRGVFVQTVTEFTAFVAALVRQPMAGLRPAAGGPAGGLVAGLVGAASPAHSSGFGAATATGRPVRMIPAPATLPLPEIVRRLNAAQPPALLGYPSKLAELAAERQAGRLRIAPRTVTAIAELLTPQDRALIEEGFGVLVTDQFVSTEGLAGRSDPGGRVLEFATDICLAELVDADGQPVPDGVRSARVLVTNLHNFTQPLIRYELTDCFTGWPSGPGGYLRATVDGRADEVFRYGAVHVHPHVLRSVLVATPGVREYQVRQTGHGIDVAAVADGPVDVTALGARLGRGLRAAGLTAPQVTVGLVGAIGRNPQTGKVRRFVPAGTDVALIPPA